MNLDFMTRCHTLISRNKPVGILEYPISEWGLSEEILCQGMYYMDKAVIREIIHEHFNGVSFSSSIPSKEEWWSPSGLEKWYDSIWK